MADALEAMVPALPTEPIEVGGKVVEVDRRILDQWSWRDKPNEAAPKQSAPANDMAKAEPAAAPSAPAAKQQGPDVYERAAARRARAEAERERAQQYEQRLSAIAEQTLPAAENYHAIKQAHARGDFHEVARLLGAESWNQVADHYVRTLSDPNHTRVLELERREAEREAAARQRSEEAKAQAQRLHNEQRIAHAKAYISTKMRESGDPLLADLHGQPEVRDAIFDVMHDHFNKTGEELSLDQALDKKQRNGMTVREGLDSYEGFAERLRAAKAKRAKPATTEAKPAAKQASSKPRTRRDDDDDWTKRAAQKLRDAFGSEREKERY